MKKKSDYKQIALERIEILFREARKTFKSDKELANKYIKNARRLSAKYKAKIPSKLRKQFCKHCYNFLMPGKNCRVRTNKEGMVVYYCLDCKKFSKFRYKS